MSDDFKTPLHVVVKYLAIFSTLCFVMAFLVGCSDPLTLEQVEKANTYCLAKNGKLETSSGWSMLNTPVTVWCVNDAKYFEVSKENIK
jgi:hypothetical protein